MVNETLIRPYFLGGYIGGGWLTSHMYKDYGKDCESTAFEPVLRRLHVWDKYLVIHHEHAGDLAQAVCV